MTSRANSRPRERRRHYNKDQQLKGTCQMKFKLLGRVALLACVSIAMVCGLTSCATSTLGYLYVTAVQYGQIASLRLDINSGAIKSVNCNTGNGDQGNCVVSSGGSYPTKIVLASSDTLMYVLNTAYDGNPASITLFTLGASGSVYSTGQSYNINGQNPVDMYLSPGGNVLYVLNQYLPADVSTACATPTPSTCKGGINAFQLDGKGNLTPVICPTGDGCLNGGSTFDSYVFPVNYEPGFLNSGFGGSRMLAISGLFYVLDESAPGTPEIHSFSISGSGALVPGNPSTTTVSGSKQLSSIVAGIHVYVSDYQTGQIFIFTPNGTSLAPNGVVCPSALVQPGTLCTVNPGSNANLPVALDAMITNGMYLYVADYSNNTVFALQDTSTGTILQATNGGNNTSFGLNPTCLTLSSSPQFLYGAGNGAVTGYQINTSTGGLSTNLHAATAATFTGVVPCVMFTPRT
jgi:6-phosphogluconolactonase